jgi:rSAM/selenodomain-associated transferase 2
MRPRTARLDATIRAMSPTLSIVMPCLNEAAGIAATLAPLQPLRGRGIEVVVVDGGSSDDTMRLAKPLADRAIVATRGRASQMNAGAAIARGDVLLFLHADCRLPASADHLIIDGLATGAKQWGRFDIAFDGAQPCMRAVAQMMNWRSRLTGIATGDQGIFVTRGLFLAHNGFPDIPLMEDVALSKRLKMQNPPLCLTERITASARRWEEHGVLRTILLMWRLRFAYFVGADPAKLALRYASVHRRD